jgi:molybdopterin biosynthesis enzyme
LSSTTLADAFLLTEEESEGFAEGDEVRVWLYDE